MSEMVLGDVALWHRHYLAAKPSHAGIDADGLACPLHRSKVCSHLMRDSASCQALPCPIVRQWALVPFWGVRSPRAWILEGVFTIWVPVLPNPT
jgi:hypothetical protein